MRVETLDQVGLDDPVQRVAHPRDGAAREVACGEDADADGVVDGPESGVTAFGGS